MGNAHTREPMIPALGEQALLYHMIMSSLGTIQLPTF